MLLLAGSCGGEEGGRSPPPRSAESGFVSRSHETGVGFRNHTGMFGEKLYLVESKGGGVLLLDYDGDADIDLYCVDGNSFRLDEEGNLLTRRANPEAGNRLYRNDGRWHFTDVTETAGVADDSWGVGGAVGDFDNDGDPDVFVCNWGENVLYRNEGDGRFRDVSAEAGVAGGPAEYSTCAAFFDADGDGDLDLYVSNYADMEKVIRRAEGKPPGSTRRGVWMYAGPLGFDAQADHLYENLGDGRFREGGRLALEGQRPAYAFQVVPLDVEGDGDSDLYVANDSMENVLWVNDGSGRFENLGDTAGVALDEALVAQAGMGVDVADYDQDGRLDIVVTNFCGDKNTLYRNASREGMLLFQDVTERVGLAAASADKVSWGIGFRDFDQDGVLDLFVSNGHVYPTPRQEFWFCGGYYQQTPNLFRGLGAPRYKFEDITESAGPGLSEPRLGRGASFADLDGDGDIDIVQACLNQYPVLLENRLPGPGNWIRIRPEGTRSNRDGIGTRIMLEAGGGRIRQFAEHRLASSFGSSQSPSMHWGLGDASVVDRLTVRWPTGKVQVFTDVPANRSYRIREGFERIVPDVGRPAPSKLSVR